MHVLSSSTEPSDNNKWHNFHANSYELNASEARALPFQDEIAGSSQITITLNSSPKLYQEEAGSAQEMDHRKRRHSRHKHNWFKGSKWKHLLQKRAANKNLEQISGKLDYKSFPNSALYGTSLFSEGHFCRLNSSNIQHFPGISSRNCLYSSCIFVYPSLQILGIAGARVDFDPIEN
eukprot:TCALIF_00638-PA protein Name:"Protein of unknown function" AED:0.04 eAED:0.04 QI:61/0.75/0.4/1/0.25/0.2/5/0/176